MGFSLYTMTIKNNHMLSSMKNGVGALFGVCNRKKEKTVNEKS